MKNLNTKILIMAVGRRTEIVGWFNDLLPGNIFVQDRDIYAPALYRVERENRIIIDDRDYDLQIGYVKAIIKFCQENEIAYIFSLIDTIQPMLEYYREYFYDAGIIIWQTKHVERFYSKIAFYENFKLKINIPETVLIKDNKGSGSSGIEKVVQPFIDGIEYNCQVYFGFHDSMIKSFFSAKKILMRAGETDRAISKHCQLAYEEIKKLEGQGLRGAIDIDVIICDNKCYIIDVNPRFGGGYPLAHFCMRENFIDMTVKEMCHIEIEKPANIWKSFDENIGMMKYNGLHFERF